MDNEARAELNSIAKELKMLRVRVHAVITQNDMAPREFELVERAIDGLWFLISDLMESSGDLEGLKRYAELSKKIFVI